MSRLHSLVCSFRCQSLLCVGLLFTVSYGVHWGVDAFLSETLPFRSMITGNSQRSKQVSRRTQDSTELALARRQHYRITHCMSSRNRDEELELLQKENERLKIELASSKERKEKSKSFNPLKALGEIFLPKLKSGEENAAEKRGETEMVSGRKRKDRGTRNRQLQRGQTGVGSSLDKFLEDVPFPFNLAGGLVKGVANVMEESFRDSQDDVELVMEATERALRRDSRASQVLGEDAECLSPMGRSYSKTTVNGVSSTSVALQMPVRGNMNQGTVSVQASIGGGTGSNEVTLRTIDLAINGRRISVNTSGGNGRGTSGASRRRASRGSSDGDDDIVDVDYVES